MLPLAQPHAAQQAGLKDEHADVPECDPGYVSVVDGQQELLHLASKVRTHSRASQVKSKYAV